MRNASKTLEEFRIDRLLHRMLRRGDSAGKVVRRVALVFVALAGVPLTVNAPAATLVTGPQIELPTTGDCRLVH